MRRETSKKEVFGFVHPASDVHTLGSIYAAKLLEDAGYKAVICDNEIARAVEEITAQSQFVRFKKWIIAQKITRLGFSYRLEPQNAKLLFGRFYHKLKKEKMLAEYGGAINRIYFAGLPLACEKIRKEFGEAVEIFRGDEEIAETLKKFGVPEIKIEEIAPVSDYDKFRKEFATDFIVKEKYEQCKPQTCSHYNEYGSKTDNITKRINCAKKRNALPLTRVHAGPYDENRNAALKTFNDWSRKLAKENMLDVLSIGASQLTQSNFGEDWSGKNNGGGVPINSEEEFFDVWLNSRPMLIRSYAGTKNVLRMAKILEKTINNAWHALSLWWFSEIDGRGSNTVLENLREHFDTLKYVAEIGKPYEPNIPHHFAFRGADDYTYALSGLIGAKTAKKIGIKTIVLQTMLNTPKFTTGKADLAKTRALYKATKELEDGNFRIYLQPRAGLDFFSPDLLKAKIQLAETALLADDIAPDNPAVPELIHVVGYSEAVQLATPEIINESIKITVCAIREYRKIKKQGKARFPEFEKETRAREEKIYAAITESLALLEKHYENLYSPEKLYEIFLDGIFPLPYLTHKTEKYPNAIRWKTAPVNGGMEIVDNFRKPVNCTERVKKIIYNKKMMLI